MAFAVLSKPKRPTVVATTLGPRRRGAHPHRPVQSPSRTETCAAPPQVAPTATAPVLQTKLEIGEPHDKYEQEADRVAAQVMRMAEPQALEGAAISPSASPSRVQRVCRECEEEVSSRPVAVQRMCPECEEELQRQPLEDEDEEETLQAKEISGGTPEVTSNVQAQIHGLRGRGQPLPPSVRNFFEPRFGYRFGRVRIHTDGKAAESARAVRARAYTVGRDVVFGARQFAPGTIEGRRLLAHELTHVVQQGAVRSDRSRVRASAAQPLAGRIQRQPVPGDPSGQSRRDPGKAPPPPPFEVKFDFKKMRLVFCVTFPKPVGRICSDSIQDAIKKACEIKPSLPWCKNVPKKKVPCSPLNQHFQPGKKGGKFEDKCCVKNLKESEETCCEKERMVLRGIVDVPGCCPPGQKAGPGRHRCLAKKKKKKVPPIAKPPCPADSVTDLAFCNCPPARMNILKGTCCPEGQHGSVMGECIPTTTPKPKPEKPEKKPAQTVFPILFRIDRPQAWQQFADSVTTDGAAAFKLLVARLRAESDLNVELSAHASSDRPANDPDYNFRLTRRRVRATAKELVEGNKVDSSRLEDAPDSPAKSCRSLGSGLRSCGDTSASPVPEAKDRNVVARIFKRNASAE